MTVDQEVAAFNASGERALAAKEAALNDADLVYDEASEVIYARYQAAMDKARETRDAAKEAARRAYDAQESTNYNALSEKARLKLFPR